MAQLWKGAVAACVFALGAGGVASARGQQGQERESTQREQQQDESYGGSGQQGMGGQREQKQKTAELNGTVVDYRNKTAHLKLENGAVVPVTISSRTQFEGGQQEQRGTGGAGQQGQQMQVQPKAQEVQPGDELTATVTAQNGQNVAEKIEFGKDKGKEEKLEGTVARASSSMLELDHDGAIIPLKLDKDTQFTGDVKSARELKEGDQVRASFRLENGTRNVATKIDARGEKSRSNENQPWPQGQQQKNE